MTVYLSDKRLYNANDSYEKKMRYTTCLFGASEQDYNNIINDPYLKNNKVIWLLN